MVDRVSMRISGLTDDEGALLAHLIRVELARASVDVNRDGVLDTLHVQVEAQPNLPLLAQTIVANILRQIAQG